MSKAKEKAEQYVRAQLDLTYNSDDLGLQHWLTALDLPPNSKIENYTENRFGVYTGKIRIFFDKTTGQPASPEDYQVFLEAVCK
jgi:hypothetical protein